MSQRVIRLVRLWVTLLVVMSFGVVRAGDDCPRSEKLPLEQIRIEGPAGISVFTVEIASTKTARATGLMCRGALAEDRGMLLVYPQPVMARIWMKNTYIPLDILFIATTGQVAQIASSLLPGEQHRVFANAPVTAVLELPAGSVSRRGIRVGDKLHRYRSGKTNPTAN